jgi:exonuclease VII small subunit
MTEKTSDDIRLSRRQAVTALGAGVIVAGGAAALAGVEATNWAKQDAALQIQDLQFQLSELQKKNTAAQQQVEDAQRQLAAAKVEIEIYKGLIGLFDTLDKIGIDAVVGSALKAYAGTLAALKASIDGLKAGIVTAENALDNFESAFASIRSALTAAENAWANVSALLKNAQQLVAQATSPILPFVDQARKFFDDLLGKIPFGAGESARQTINSVVGLMVGVPAALDELENGLFRTLRDGWFSDDNARNLEATLAKPIVNGVLAPLRQFLDQVNTTLDDWETQVAKPVNNALSQREIVQQQIAAYRQQHKI